MGSTGRFTKRTIGSEPTRREPPKTEKEDPKTEAVREALRGHPYAKKYHGKEYGQ